MMPDAPLSEHPSLIELEACRTGEASEAVRAHVAACAECGAELERLRSIPRDFFIPSHASIPDAADRAIRDAIARRAQAIQVRRKVVRIVRWSSAAAASLLLVAGLWHFARPPEKIPQAAPLAKVGVSVDFDQDGSVDIVDAYLMAKMLKSNAGRKHWPAAMDLNGDGAVNEEDVQALAQRAVAVKREGV
ncbi:MAG: dockerin type I domain-containing protein [Planctomycetota bacterium]